MTPSIRVRAVPGATIVIRGRQIGCRRTEREGRPGTYDVAPADTVLTAADLADMRFHAELLRVQREGSFDVFESVKETV